MRIAAIICAAGEGRRMGLGMNKLFLTIDNQPLIIHTLKKWEAMDMVDEVVVVVGKEEEHQVRQLLVDYQIGKVSNVLPGGEERQDSVYQGILALKNDPPDIVLVHDGARPFIDAKNVQQVIDRANHHGAAALAVPVTDTIKTVLENGQIDQTLDRSRLWAMQTPQAFTYPLLLEAYRRALKDGFFGTDDASLVERMDKPVYTVKGSYENIKLTTPEDVRLAQYLLQRRKN